MRRVFESHPDYNELNRHAQMIATLKNPQVFFDGHELSKGLPEAEKKVLLDDIYVGFNSLLYGGTFRDYIEDKLF